MSLPSRRSERQSKDPHSTEHDRKGEERSGAESKKIRYLRQKKTQTQHARESKTTYLSKRMGNCEDRRIFRSQFNLVYIFSMCGCTGAMGLSGVREKKAKSSTNGVSRDSKQGE